MRRWVPVLAVLLMQCGGSEGDPGPNPPSLPASVTLWPAAPHLEVSFTVQLQADVRDSSGLVISNPSITWQSSNPTVATVSSSGLVDANAVGTATIRATVGSVMDSSVVSVVTSGGGSTVTTSYFGGTGEDMVRDVALDVQGNVYVCGSTESADFPTTAGSYDPTFNSGGAKVSDAFVAKLSPSGTIIWATFVGGPNFDRCYGMELDPQGNIVIAGRAGAGFPVSAGAFQTTFAGGPVSPAYGTQDGFVCKLSNDGTTMHFCSYFGTNDEEIIRDVAVNSVGDIYVAAGAENGGLPAAWFTNAFQKQIAGGLDAVVAKVSSNGSQVIWATYLGGAAKESGTPSIRVDASQNVYLLTATSSSGLPTGTGFDPSYNGAQDMFLAKFNSTGSSLLFGTYLGGSGGEASETHGLTIDAQGNIIVAATTNSTNYPTTSTAFQKVLGGVAGSVQSDIFVTKVATTGALLASTYIGGRLFESVEGVTTDATGNVYLTGSTFDAGTFPADSRVGSLGDTDFIVVKLTSSLQQAVFSRIYGGGLQDMGRGAVVGSNGVLYTGGETKSTDFPTVNPLQPGFQGGLRDGLLVFVTVP